MGLFNVPEESYEIEILEDDLDVFNDKKIESEKIIDMDLLFQSALQGLMATNKRFGLEPWTMPLQRLRLLYKT